MTLYIATACVFVIALLALLLCLRLLGVKALPPLMLLTLFRGLLWLATHAPGVLQAWSLATLSTLEIRTGKYLRCWPGVRPTLVDLDDDTYYYHTNVSGVNS